MTVAVVGGGPAGLMVASKLVASGAQVTLFERRKALGRKLLIAGSSGLNITHDMEITEFSRQYSGSFGSEAMLPALREMDAHAWIRFIEDLGIKTFLGTSRRYFVGGMKAAELLRVWTESLVGAGVRIETGGELVAIAAGERSVRLGLENGTSWEGRAACLALGGGSWETEAPRWPALLGHHDIEVAPFAPSNAGYEVSWPRELLRECEGQPLKNVVLTTARGTRRGELMITGYGLEGTPIYALGAVGEATLDLKPDLELGEIIRRMAGAKENLSPLRRLKRFVKPSEPALALLFHLSPAEDLADASRLAARLKAFPIRLERPRGLAESISSSGGIVATEISSGLELRKLPGVFVAGEMIDWDAPTGGFLIQGAVSTGALAARQMAALDSNA